MPEWSVPASRCRRHHCHTANTIMVNGIVIVGKYHHWGDTVNVDLPLLSIVVLKKTMLKIA